MSADTGRRCPRCDCADGHEQCEHCKVCEHARPSSAGPCARPECGGEQHTDPWGTPVQCPHAEPDPATQLAFAREYARVQRDHWQRRLDELGQRVGANKETP